MKNNCEGCGLEDCSPRYHEDADMMFCDFCFANAVDKYETDPYSWDDEIYLWDERDE